MVVWFVTTKYLSDHRKIAEFFRLPYNESTAEARVKPTKKTQPQSEKLPA